MAFIRMRSSEAMTPSPEFRPSFSHSSPFFYPPLLPNHSSSVLCWDLGPFGVVGLIASPPTSTPTIVFIFGLRTPSLPPLLFDTYNEITKVAQKIPGKFFSLSTPLFRHSPILHVYHFDVSTWLRWSHMVHETSHNFLTSATTHLLPVRLEPKSL